MKNNRFSFVYVRNDIPLNYVNVEDKGKGAEAKYQKIMQNPPVLIIRNFYENTLGWDFQKIWTITEGEFYLYRKNTDLLIYSKLNKI